MLVGVPKEIKDNEYRVGIVPSTVRELTDKGHEVVVETRAGSGAGLADADYKAAGAAIGADADVVYGRAELIVKVKEPLAVSLTHRPHEFLMQYFQLLSRQALLRNLPPQSTHNCRDPSQSSRFRKT